MKSNSISTFTRIFDFGTATTNYMFLSPAIHDHLAERAKPRFDIRTPSVGDQIIN